MELFWQVNIGVQTPFCPLKTSRGRSWERPCINCEKFKCEHQYRRFILNYFSFSEIAKSFERFWSFFSLSSLVRSKGRIKTKIKKNLSGPHWQFVHHKSHIDWKTRSFAVGDQRLTTRGVGKWGKWNYFSFRCCLISERKFLFESFPKLRSFFLLVRGNFSRWVWSIGGEILTWPGR